MSFRFSLSAWNQQLEQDRTPSVLLHQPKLERQAADQLRNRQDQKCRRKPVATGAVRVIARPRDSASRSTTLCDRRARSRNRKRVELAEIQLPSDLLCYGFLFIDTPGLDSGITANTKATRRFLPEIDAAIVFSTSSRFWIRGSRSLAEPSPVAKEALHRPQQSGSSFARRAGPGKFVRESLTEQLGEAPLLFPLSARDALCACQAETKRHLTAAA